MDCQQVQEEYSALLDGELDPETQAAVEAHLAGCAACLRELDKLKRVNDVYDRLPAHPAPEGFEGRVRAALRENVVALPQRRRRPLALWPALAAAAMLVVVAGAVLLQFEGPANRMQMSSLSSETESAPLGEGMGRAEVEGVAARRGAGETLVHTLGRAAGAKGMPAADEARPTAMAEPPREELESLGYIENAVDRESLALQEPPPGAAEAGARVLLHDTDARPGTPATVAAESAADVPAAPPPSARRMVSVASRAEPTVMADGIEAAAAAPKAAATEEMGAARLPDETKARSGETMRGFGAGKAGRDLAGAQTAAKDGATKTVGSRTFVFHEGTWYQQGYAGEETIPLERGADALRTLVAKHGDVAAILEAGERIVFRLDKKWYRVAPGSVPNAGAR